MEPITASRRLREYCPILAYHSISDERIDGLSVSTAEFESQLRLLRESGFESSSITELLEGLEQQGRKGRSKRIVITFDDGYRDNYEKAFPLLEKYGYTATFFIVTDLVGTDRLHTFDLDKPGRGLGSASSFTVMNWEQVRALRDGGMQIGSHTCTHPVLDWSLPDSALTEEIARSRGALESKLDQQINLFCYPRGKLDARAYPVLRETGYSAAVVTPGIRDQVVETKYTLKRIGIYRSGLNKFRFKLTPLFFRLRLLRGLVNI